MRSVRAALCRRPLRVLACVVLVGMSGCAHAGSTPSPAPVDRRATVRSIVLCTTTEADLRAALGEPTRDGFLRADRILSWIIGEGTVVSYLAVLLDARGVVVDLVWDVPTEVPWTPADQSRSGAGTR